MTRLHDVWKCSLMGMLSLFLAGIGTTPSVAARNPSPAVFVAPTAEMVDVSHGLAMPLGGIGTGFSVFGKYGFVDVYFDGRPSKRQRLEIDRAPRDKPLSPSSSPKAAKARSSRRRRWTGWRMPSRWIKSGPTRICPKDISSLTKQARTRPCDDRLFAHGAPRSNRLHHPGAGLRCHRGKQSGQDRSLQLALLHRDALMVRDGKAVLVTPDGETAFACDGGAADTHGVSASLRLAPGKRRTVRFYIAWDYPSVRPTSSAAARRIGAFTPSVSRTRHS